MGVLMFAFLMCCSSATSGLCGRRRRRDLHVDRETRPPEEIFEIIGDGMVEDFAVATRELGINATYLYGNLR